MLATLVLVCCSAVPANTPQTLSAANSVQYNTFADAPLPEALNAADARPESPAPKLNSNDAAASGSSSSSATPAARPISSAPVRAASNEQYETSRKRVIWYGLMAAGHGSAAFDAWTTRRAISSGYGVEGDPTQRPFAHSNAIYATTQVSPLLMDYLGHHLMRSRYPLMRRFWWVPQAANASISFGAAVHNYRVVP